MDQDRVSVYLLDTHELVGTIAKGALWNIGLAVPRDRLVVTKSQVEILKQQPTWLSVAK
jgi:hypothetical protein